MKDWEDIGDYNIFSAIAKERGIFNWLIPNIILNDSTAYKLFNTKIKW